MRKMLFAGWLLPFLMITGCTRIVQPEFRRVEGFRVSNLALTEAEVDLSVVYYNPNKFGVRVKEAVVDVSMDSIAIGRFIQPVEITTGSATEFAIPLKAKISLATLLQSKLPQLVGKEVLVQATGSVKVGKAGVFVTRDINYSGRQRLDPGLIKNPAGAGLIQ